MRGDGRRNRNLFGCRDLKALSQEEIREGARLYRDDLRPRPKTRGECASIERPCPFVSCRYHLLIDVTHAGSLQSHWGDLEALDTMPDTCALDVADRGSHRLEGIALCMNITRERVRQIEFKALMKFRKQCMKAGITAQDMFAFAHAESPMVAAQREDSPGQGDVRVVREACADKLRENRERQREEFEMRSKLDDAKGKARKLIDAALVDRSITSTQLHNQLAEIGYEEMTQGGISAYLSTRRRAIEDGAIPGPDGKKKSKKRPKKKEEPVERPKLEKVETALVKVERPPEVVPPNGYLVLPTGAIWTSSSDEALELSRKILHEEDR